VLQRITGKRATVKTERRLSLFDQRTGPDAASLTAHRHVSVMLSAAGTGVLRSQECSADSAVYPAGSDDSRGHSCSPIRNCNAHRV
jgi:hypothetical protein